MSKLWKLMGIAALATGVATGANAAVLFSASLSIALAGADLSFPATGATGTAVSDTNATVGAGSAFAGTQTTTFPPTITATAPVDKIQVFIGSNAAGSFTGASPAAVGGAALFNGTAYLFATKNAGTPFLVVPVKIGTATTFTVAGSGLGFTIFSAPWTAGSATIDYGNVTTPATVMVTGMNALTAAGAGKLTLVSPGKVFVTTGNKLPLVGTLVLNYVPEPGTLLLLGSGALGLAILGRRRAH